MTTTKPEYELTVDHSGAVLRWQGQTFDIEATDLREGGWEHDPTCDRDHCGDGDCDECQQHHLDDLHGDPVEVLKRWHDEESGHEGPAIFCYAEPCKSLRDTLEGA